MKKKNILLVTIIALCCVIITGCNGSNNKIDESNNKNVEANTVGTKLAKLFDETVENTTDLEKIANTINESDIIIPKTMVMEINKDDYVEGFNTEIVGFKKGYSVKTMINAIPFVVYIFEAENPKEFEQSLKDNHNLRWNICVEAEEMVTSRKDNIVFFVMSPLNFSE